MSGSQFNMKLQIANVDEGRCLRDIDEDFLRLQGDLLAYLERHPEVPCEEAKGKLVITLELKCVDRDLEIFDIKDGCKLTIPGRPTRVTKALSGVEDGTGLRMLCVKPSGSSDGDPQGWPHGGGERRGRRAEAARTHRTELSGLAG